MNINKISIDPGTITRRLALVAMAMVAISMGMQMHRLMSNREHVFGLAMMSLDRENNVPALFSTVLLLSASTLLAFIAILERNHKAPDVPKWTILSVGFLLMGMDESLSLHEHMIEPMRHLLGGQHLGIFFFAWVIPAIALVAVLGVFFLPFMLRLPRRTAIGFAISAAIYLGGALGVELVEGWWREGHGHRNVAYHALVSLEEGMEMMGAILFIHVLLSYIATRYGEVRIGLVGAAAMTDAAQPALQPQVGQTLARSTSE